MAEQTDRQMYLNDRLCMVAQDIVKKNNYIFLFPTQHGFSHINKQTNQMQMGVRSTHHKTNHFSLTRIVAFSEGTTSI